MSRHTLAAVLGEGDDGEDLDHGSHGGATVSGSPAAAAAAAGPVAFVGGAPQQEVAAVGEAGVTAAAAAAAAPAVSGRCGVEAASLQRCFGLANGVDLLYATLGWNETESSTLGWNGAPPETDDNPANDTDADSHSEQIERRPPPCALRVLSVTHMELPGRRLPTAVNGGGGVLVSLSLTNSSFECSAEALIRALAAVGPGRYCSPRHRIQFELRHEGSKCVG